MRLAKLSEFRRLVFTPDSAPSMRTLYRRFEQIPGATCLNGVRYVDLDAFDRACRASSSLHEKLAQLKENPLVAGLF